ncbi:hypothetical protein DFS34DRAFT_588691 [Phlyctochytrium arcticum]|nr:hypothetical protein DFS34DRAFT_588691 [Phlyctochytrium arcticum]
MEGIWCALSTRGSTFLLFFVGGQRVEIPNWKGFGVQFVTISALGRQNEESENIHMWNGLPASTSIKAELRTISAIQLETGPAHSRNRRQAHTASFGWMTLSFANFSTFMQKRRIRRFFYWIHKFPLPRNRGIHVSPQPGGPLAGLQALGSDFLVQLSRDNDGRITFLQIRGQRGGPSGWGGEGRICCVPETSHLLCRDRIDNSIIREPIDLREDKLQSIEEALLWARGSPPVESYLRTAISYAQQADVRLRQQRRHMLRLLREVGVVEGKVMAKFAGIPENSDVISTFPPAYDLITLHALFVDNRAATKVIDCLVSEGVLNNSKSFWNKLSWRKREVRSLMTQGGVASLFEMALKIPVRATEVDEEDVRSVWAAVPRAALPSFEDTDVGISLEFRHTFQSQADSIIVTKSDVTIYVANDVNDIAVCVAEVDKTELGTKGMIHKDYIKAPGEAIQQMLSLVSANFLSEDELRNLQFLWTHLKMERSLLCPQDGRYRGQALACKVS